LQCEELAKKTTKLAAIRYLSELKSTPDIIAITETHLKTIQNKIIRLITFKFI